jgi:hypothetical protein
MMEGARTSFILNESLATGRTVETDAAERPAIIVIV